MNQPDLNKNKRFAELVGICWCEPEYYEEDFDRCPKCGVIYSAEREATEHPDYAADPRLVLEVMKRDDWKDFYKWASDHKRLLDYNSQGTVFVRLDVFRDLTGKLRDAAIEWMEK